MAFLSSRKCAIYLKTVNRKWLACIKGRSVSECGVNSCDNYKSLLIVHRYNCKRPYINLWVRQSCNQIKITMIVKAFNNKNSIIYRLNVKCREKDDVNFILRLDDYSILLKNTLLYEVTQHIKSSLTALWFSHRLIFLCICHLTTGTIESIVREKKRIKEFLSQMYLESSSRWSFSLQDENSLFTHEKL